jgi:hypothetical protein
MTAATELASILRALAQILDSADRPEPAAEQPQCSAFVQMLQQVEREAAANYANTPSSSVQPIADVTVNAGGGVNGPKQPYDIRVKDPSAGHTL